MKVSIVIPVFNKSNFTKSCLTDLDKLSKDRNEIIVVDNASSDATEEEVRKFSDVKYIKNSENLGFGKACGKGYAAAAGDIVLFLNNDIRVKSNHNNWTDIFIDELSKDKNRLIGPTGGLVDIKNGFNFIYETNDKNKAINYMSGWCLASHIDTWKKLDLSTNEVFSKDFFAYFEDTDLSFRAKELGIGFSLISVPVIHFGKITSSQINTSKLYNESRSIFIKKWQHLVDKK